MTYKYRFIDQSAGWLGEKTHPTMPDITNLRLDPCIMETRGCQRM